jgi:hypothetical protein
MHMKVSTWQMLMRESLTFQVLQVPMDLFSHQRKRPCFGLTVVTIFRLPNNSKHHGNSAKLKLDSLVGSNTLRRNTMLVSVSAMIQF